MPVGTQQHDYYLQAPGGPNNGYMLVRHLPHYGMRLPPLPQPEIMVGRGWSRTGQADTPGRRSPTDVQYGQLPDTIDHPEVWDDWSAGFGDAYRRPEQPNKTHWSRGFDTRFPRQVIHAQAPQLIASGLLASGRTNVNWIADVPFEGTLGTKGLPAILLLGNWTGALQQGRLTWLLPTRFPNTSGSAFIVQQNITGSAGAVSYGNRPALFGSFIYIPNLSGSSFYQVGVDQTVTLGPNQTARWFQTAGGRMWFDMDGRQLRSVAAAADPLVSTNYSATLSIGDGTLLSGDATTVENQLYVGFPNGVYQGNLTGTFNNIAADLGELADTDNCRDLAPFQGGVAFPEGSHIWWYQPSTGANSTLREVGPTGIFANRSGIRGRFTCVKGNGKWLYAGLFTGSGSYFMVGRDASPPLPFVWHPLHDFLGLNVKVHRIHVDGVTRDMQSLSLMGTANIPNRIWCATEASYGSRAGATAPVFYWPIPYGDNNPLSDLTFSPNYMGSAHLDLPAADWGAPGTSKVWRTAETWADNLLSGAQYADLYYAADWGATTLIGRAQTSPKDVRYFAANPFVQGQALALSFDSFTASLNVTPVYRANIVRGFMRPRSVDQISAKTHIGDRVVDRYGNEMRDGATMLRELRGYAAGSAPVLLTDLTGAQNWVSVLAPIAEDEFYQSGEDNPDIMATVEMAVMEFSAS